MYWRLVVAWTKQWGAPKHWGAHTWNESKLRDELVIATPSRVVTFARGRKCWKRCRTVSYQKCELKTNVHQNTLSYCNSIPVRQADQTQSHRIVTQVCRPSHTIRLSFQLTPQMNPLQAHLRRTDNFTQTLTNIPSITNSKSNERKTKSSHSRVHVNKLQTKYHTNRTAKTNSA